MDWILEDNMVDGLFFCATLTGRRGSHNPFVQTGAETSDTGAEAVKADALLGRVALGGICWVSGMKIRRLVGLVIRPLRRTYVAVVR